MSNLNQQIYGPEESMNALIQMGIHGHYPLFHEFLNKDLGQFKKKFQKINSQDMARARKFFKDISRHRSLDHKRTWLLSLNDEDRIIFIRAFIKMVEGKILDQNPEIQ